MVQMGSIVITELNWGLATHLDYRALIPGLHTYTYVRLCSQWTPHWWNCTGWGLCQVNNTDWSLMLNFLEVPASLSASCTCSVLKLSPGCTVGWIGISALRLPAGQSDLKHGLKEYREKKRPWEQRTEEIGLISSKQWDLMYFNTSLFSSHTIKSGSLISLYHPGSSIEVNCLKSWWRQSVTWWV